MNSLYQMYKQLILLLTILASKSYANWLQSGSDIDGAEDEDQSGASVSLSANGETLAVGALGHDSMKGHVRVYKNANPITKEYIEQFYNENAGCGTSGIPFDCTRLHVGENNKLECF